MNEEENDYTQKKLEEFRKKHGHEIKEPKQLTEQEILEQVKIGICHECGGNIGEGVIIDEVNNEKNSVISWMCEDCGIRMGFYSDKSKEGRAYFNEILELVDKRRYRMNWFKKKKVENESYYISTSYCLECGGITKQNKSVYRKYERPSEHRCTCVSDSKKEG